MEVVNQQAVSQLSQHKSAVVLFCHVKQGWIPVLGCFLFNKISTVEIHQGGPFEQNICSWSSSEGAPFQQNKQN